MIKKVEYELNYRIKGNKLSKKIEIDFVPNQRHETFSKIQAEIYEIRANWQHIQALEEEIKLVYEARPENYSASIKVFKEEIKKLEDEIRKCKASNLIERRYELLKDILIDNGYSKDAELMSWEFWNNCVNPNDINELLEMAIWKDIDNKKKVH